MALDLNDLLDPPYGFGECWDETYGASIHCDAWQEPDQTISIYYRKVGSHVTVVIPEFLRPVKAGIGTKDCDIIINASFHSSHPTLSTTVRMHSRPTSLATCRSMMSSKEMKML